MRYWLLIAVIFTSSCVTSKSKLELPVARPYIAKSFATARAVKYKTDVPEEHWQQPDDTERLKTGDCEDKAFYLQYLLTQKGIESKVVLGFIVGNESDYDGKKNLHAWNELEIDGVVYVADSTATTFRPKKELDPRYSWNIMMSKDKRKNFSYLINDYIDQANKRKLTKFSKSIERSFFTIE